MADVIRKATNKFTKGLIMDFSPENTRNEVLTHALNATLLTFNGNELSLQNDMGNGRVETAFLPEGYMPVGTCEYGGVIYIVSYNPLENKSQIGCFPSPERNISSDELGQSEDVTLNTGDFQILNSDNIPTGDLKNTSKYVLLRNDNLNPGDKFIINSDTALYNEALLNLQKRKDNGIYQDVPNPVIALNVVSIEDSGRIIYLNSDLRDYEKTISTDPTISAKYHILGERSSSNLTGKIDLDSYRNVLSSGYNVFKSKTSGKLAILAELVAIDSYSVTHSVIPKKINIEGVTQNQEGCYDVIIHTEVEPQVTLTNYNTVPKLSYYHLEESQGYLQTYDNTKGFELFTPSGYFNDRFLGINLKDVLTPTDSKSPINLDQLIGSSGKFNFPRKGTYHGRMEEHTGFITEYEGKDIYTKFSEDKYHRVAPSQVKDSNGVSFKSYFTRDLQAKFYRYNPKSTGYTKWENTTLDNTKTYYVASTEFGYEDAKRDTKYQNNVTLYKNISEYKSANDTIRNDSSIEKFQEIKVYTATKASEAELADYERVTLYQKTSTGYQQLTGKPLSGVDYYTVEVDTIMQSVGSSINVSDFQHVELFYCPGNKIYVEATEKDLEKYWDFTTYPVGTNAPIILYYRVNKDAYKLATESEMINFVKDAITLYYKDDYELIIGDKTAGILNSNEPIFVVVPMDSYVLKSEFNPSTAYNYIQGCEKPKGSNEPADGYPKDDPIVLCTVADFVPIIHNEGSDEEVVEQYPDLKLGSIKVPGVLTAYGLDLPFKYSYTITPCMNYGKLKHLLVSNTVDFSNLHAFEQSNFNEWRYHIDGNQLRLTFGAEIFDTHEDYKADGLILEFYDLWGFAGSLEINNRKSYSGTFTKLISLNTIGGLSTNRVFNGSYTSNFKRNVNIHKDSVEGQQVFKYLDQEVVYSDEGGWSGISDSDNDCGVLYSNLIYGVKAYIRRTTDKGVEFLHKKDYFLFTLPIYNDYYYTITDFNTLVNPKLEMQLTYKLVDSSNKTPYTGNDISNGYNEDDAKTIASFTGNSYADSFNVIKYYQYQGVSNLYIEVGLREIYKDINLLYDPDINKIFKYKLRLIGDEEGSSYTIKSGSNPLLSPTETLKYKHTKGTLPLDINKFGFGSDHNSEVSGFNIEDKRFITYDGSNPFSIEYNFVVGYYIQMTDIVTKEFPTTTICALHHIKPDGQPNYEDFNIKSAIDSDNDDEFFNTGIVYNAGTRYKKRWGICHQQATSGSASDQLSIYSEFEKDAEVIGSAGIMNAGSDLEVLLPSIGKLSFCQPHAHCVRDTEGVNVHGGSWRGGTSHNYHIIPNEGGGMLLHQSSWESFWGTGSSDDTYGKIPMNRMYTNPKYSMILNTVKSITTQAEFIPTMHRELMESNVQALYCNGEDGWTSWQGSQRHRKFVGLDGSQLATFNKKLLETMKYIYAYNPDYPTVSKLDGKIKVDDLSVQISSNIINELSEFNFKENQTLNDFIYFGGVCVSDYLRNLNTYSGIRVTEKKESGLDSWIDLLQFIPDTTYCGSKEYPYVLSALTYSFHSDNSIVSDFNSQSSTITIRHYDGSTTSMNGNINTTSLYGYDKFQSAGGVMDGSGCLYQLDVSNYTIATTGKLTARSEYRRDVLNKVPNTIVPVKSVTTNYSEFDKYGTYSIKSTYSNNTYNPCFRGTSIVINDLMYDTRFDNHRLFIKNNVAQYKSYDQERPKLWYGPLDTPQSKSGDGWSTYWNYTWNDNLDKNLIYLYSGPCFTPNNI